MYYIIILVYITDFSAHIAPEPISENPNLKFSWGDAPDLPKRAQGMEACLYVFACTLSDSLEPPLPQFLLSCLLPCLLQVYYNVRQFGNLLNHALYIQKQLKITKFNVYIHVNYFYGLQGHSYDWFSKLLVYIIHCICDIHIVYLVKEVASLQWSVN